MVCQHIRVLLVEDNPGDARLIHWMLRETGEVRFELTEADRLAAARRLLAEDHFSVVLLHPPPARQPGAGDVPGSLRRLPARPGGGADRAGG
jgi:hypothetical protein